LRLWHRDLGRGEINQEEFQLPRLSYEIARPVASAKYLFAINKGKLVALDAVTGEIVREYPGLDKPKELVNHRDKVIASDATSVRCFSSETGEQLWAFDAGAPRNVAAGDDIVSLIQGQPKRGETPEAVALDLYTGELKWRRADFDFLDKVYRTVQYGDHLAFECSTLNNDDDGNAIHVVSSQTGQDSWSKAYPPGMNHARQARPMFMGEEVWILHGGNTNTADKENAKRLPTEISSLNAANGETLKTHPAGLTHCFPPVATTKYMFAGELDLTNLESGEVVANRITKANCSRENGWVPANGLVYTTPKHCTCWPMLRGFVAMATKAPGGNHPADLPTEKLTFTVAKGTTTADPAAPAANAADWPVYRGDKWRSGSTSSAGPEKLETLWTVALSTKAEIATFAGKPAGPILYDWAENAFVKGPLSPPTVANGIAYITRPDAHEVVALNASDSAVKWRFTADGRVDLPPSIHQGLALFGTHMGSVYALRADNGEVVWRIDAALNDERIVAYGQVESPWPVAGSVLIIGDDAFFAAGRQPFADGGVFVHSVKALTGEQNWVHRIDSLPQQGYYENSGLEFDPIDILHQDGDAIAMSRWLISRDGTAHTVDKWRAFSKIAPGDAGEEAWIPGGSWTYGPRHQHRFRGEAPRRPLVVAFNGDVISSLDGGTDVFRRDFDTDSVKKFDHKWITGWSAGGIANKGGKPYRTYRIAEGAKWTVDPYTPAEEKKEVPIGTQVYNNIYAMALSAADGKIFTVHKDGRMRVLSLENGNVLAERDVPPPAWDGLAIADGKLFMATQAGELVCLGE
jgi:outer membrane protein assembly factor BamB